MSRDRILHKNCEHAREGNLAESGRICGNPFKSVDSIEEMWRKSLTMWMVTLKKLTWFIGRNANSFHNVESTLWYFPQCGKYNLNFPHCENYNEIVKLQTWSEGLGVDFTFAMEEQEPSPKFLGSDGTRGLKFGNLT